MSPDSLDTGHSVTIRTKGEVNKMSLQLSTTAPTSSLLGLTSVTNNDVVQAAPYIVLVSTQSCL